MDIATLAGTVIGFVIVLFGMVSDRNLTVLSGYVDMSAVIITVCGSLTSLLMSYAIRDFIKCIRAFKVVLKKSRIDQKKIVQQMTELAYLAHREGLLALEVATEEEKDIFLRKGIQMVVDGAKLDSVKEVLENDLKSMNERHTFVISFMKRWATLVQAWGMIGTLVGFVHVLAGLEGFTGIGSAMASALMAILYGSLIAYLICIPAANKLENLNNMESLGRKTEIEALLAIQTGENPRITEEKLKAFLPHLEQKETNQSSRKDDTFIR